MRIRSDSASLQHVPGTLLLSVLAITALGIWNLVAASQPPNPPVWRAQVVYVLLGWVAAAVVAGVDYRFWHRMAAPLYALNLVFLLALRVLGHRARGAESWFAVGSLRIQPSEFMKVSLVLMLAKHFHDEMQADTPPYTFSRLLVPSLLALVPIAVVLVQPDLGMALMMTFTALTVVLFARVTPGVWAFLGVAAVSLGLVLWHDYVKEPPPQRTWVRQLLKKHQDGRIRGWLNPEADPRGTNYHSIQSKIAVGSGGLWGKGFMQGTQTKLRFLPEQHSDFIFSVWAEERGFWACLLLLGLYGVVIFSSLRVAYDARDPFGAFVAVGIAASIFWQVFENIGMVTGLLPVTGITLPWMSYGGSSLLSVMIGIGLLVNISLRRHVF